LTDGPGISDGDPVRPAREGDPGISDGELVGLAREGDPAAFRLLVERHQPMVRARAAGLGTNASDVDDIMQEADALREAMATLPAGQRRAVFLHYYADLPAGQIGDQAGAARVSLHKARRRLREYLTEHRPDLVPRRLMTTVRIASAEHQRRRRVHQMQSPSHLGRRAPAGAEPPRLTGTAGR